MAEREPHVTTDEPGPHGTVVHLVSEYWPYARSGGLGEAVRGIAHHQAAAGFPTCIVMPLYRGIRERFDEIEEVGAPFPVQVGERSFQARLYRDDHGPLEPVVYFVGNDELFGRDGLYGDAAGEFDDNHLRFAFFCRAALDRLPEIAEGRTLLHAHDWHTSLTPVILRTEMDVDPRYRSVAVVLTVHNAGYQGVFGAGAVSTLGLAPHLFGDRHMEHEGRLNFLKGGIVFSDMVTTVSPTHAHELRTRMGAFGLHGPFSDLQDRLMGILNGIDYSVWDPAADPYIEATYDEHDFEAKVRNKAWLQQRTGLEEDSDLPLFGMTARLVRQKGFDIILGSGVVGEPGAQWVFLGEGEQQYRDALQALHEDHPERVAVFFDFTEEREHKLLAGADYLLMPSLYEPCGLTQMRAQRYGALPVVRRVGGLADTVDDRVTGFVFDEYEPWAFAEAIRYARDLYADRESWREHAREAMRRDFSWEASVVQYQAVYIRAHALRDDTAA